jgi:hypothetical protein
MSSRTAGVAVAVSARTVGLPSAAMTCPSAVRFVDDEQRHGQALQPGDEALVFEFLRRHEHDLDVAVGQLLQRPGFLFLTDRRIERDDALDAEVGEHVELVLHERDQRADDDGRALEQQRRKLVAQALPGARGHDR